MNKFRWFLIGIFLTIAGSASAVYIGGPLESALLEKLSSDPSGNEAQIYYNTTEKKAKVYDGATWKGLGSGSGGGGGIQLNENGDFESGLVNYSATSGLTSTSVLGEVGKGVNSGKWDAAADTDTFQTDYFLVEPLLEGKSCLAEFYYKWDAGTLTHLNVKVEAETAGDQTIAVDLVPTAYI